MHGIVLIHPLRPETDCKNARLPGCLRGNFEREHDSARLVESVRNNTTRFEKVVLDNSASCVHDSFKAYVVCNGRPVVRCNGRPAVG